MRHPDPGHPQRIGGALEEAILSLRLAFIPACGRVEGPLGRWVVAGSETLPFGGFGCRGCGRLRFPTHAQRARMNGLPRLLGELVSVRIAVVGGVGGEGVCTLVPLMTMKLS
jgi:hypothetical protein